MLFRRDTSTPSMFGRTAEGIAFAGAGVILTYFLDPDRGRSRRAHARDRLAGSIRRTGRRLARGIRYAAATATGMRHRLTRLPRGATELDDATLTHKVETELFRDPTVPKGRMNINAEHGTVVLRGRVHSRDQIERIMVATIGIDGVRGVQSLLQADEETELPFDEPPARPSDEPRKRPHDEPLEPVVAGFRREQDPDR
jgi:hypothetical protein